MNANSRPVTHKVLVANLSPSVRADLLDRSDRAGLVQAARHVVALEITGFWIVSGLPGWPLAMLFHGILLVFLFTALHETIHETAFASRWMNRVVAVVAGFLLILPPRWFRAFHFAHHRHTNDPDKDPELAGTPTTSKAGYLWRITGLPVWAEHIGGLFRIARGTKVDDFVPAPARDTIVLEARAFVVGYVVLGLTSLAAGTWLLLWIWVLPALLGQPFLRAYLMAEHTLCPHVSNMLKNTRTTFTHRIVRALAWNMPYHAEHHSYPSVPFHKLPTFHKYVRDHLGTTAEGYAAFHREVLGTMRAASERDVRDD